jgi:hypothetical protein
MRHAGPALTWLWTPILIVAAGLLREVIRLVAFIWGMSIALRNTDGPLRVRLLEAYVNRKRS